MNNHFLRKYSSRIILGGILLLFYWLFIFVTIEVFDLKIFREKITSLFAFSILGILALIAGAFLVNVMANLSIIADGSGENDTNNTENGPKKHNVFLFVVSLPLIFILLFTGNWLTVRKKERLLVANAREIIAKYSAELERAGNYRFERSYVNATGKILSEISRIDTNFPNVYLIHKVDHNDKTIYLRFSPHASWSAKEKHEPVDFIFSSTREQRKFMDSVNFEEEDHLFESRKGNYKLILPVNKGQKPFFLLLTDYQRYGKIGS